MVKLTAKEFHIMRYLLNHHSHNMTPRENFILLIIVLNRPYSIGQKRYDEVIAIINRFKYNRPFNDSNYSNKIRKL